MGRIFDVELLVKKTTACFFVQKQGHFGHLGFTVWDLHCCRRGDFLFEDGTIGIYALYSKYINVAIKVHGLSEDSKIPLVSSKIQQLPWQTHPRQEGPQGIPTVVPYRSNSHLPAKGLKLEI